MVMKDADVLGYGIAPDESFMSYKDIDEVMAAQSDLAKPVARLYPKVVIMGGE